MDPLKIAFATYMVFYLLGVAMYVAMVGRPREPVSPGQAGCIVPLNILVFVMFIIIWTRL